MKRGQHFILFDHKSICIVLFQYDYVYSLEVHKTIKWFFNEWLSFLYFVYGIYYIIIPSPNNFQVRYLKTKRFSIKIILFT
jgi:hypothetical protein